MLNYFRIFISLGLAIYVHRGNRQAYRKIYTVTFASIILVTFKIVMYLMNTSGQESMFDEDKRRYMQGEVPEQSSQLRTRMPPHLPHQRRSRPRAREFHSCLKSQLSAK